MGNEPLALFHKRCDNGALTYCCLSFSIWRCGYYPRGQGMAGLAWPSYSLLLGAISTPSACKNHFIFKAMFHFFFFFSSNCTSKSICAFFLTIFFASKVNLHLFIYTILYSRCFIYPQKGVCVWVKMAFFKYGHLPAKQLWWMEMLTDGFLQILETSLAL